MLNPKEQKQIIQSNRAAFEALALRWRNPKTGDTEFDLGEAVLNMICDYCCPPGSSISLLRHEISKWLAEANEEDRQAPLAPTTEQIPSHIRAKFKDFLTGSDSYPDFWYWNDDKWEWVLSLRDAKEDIDCIGEVTISPLENGHLFNYHILPEEDHNQWLLKFDISAVPGYLLIPVIRIPIKGSLQEAKRKVDLLLGTDTPPLPPSTTN